MKTILSRLQEAISDRIEARMWKKLDRNQYNSYYARLAADRFLAGTLTEEDIKVLGLPKENSGSETGALRWLINGLSDSHVAKIDREVSRKQREGKPQSREQSD